MRVGGMRSVRCIDRCMQSSGVKAARPIAEESGRLTHSGYYPSRCQLFHLLELRDFGTPCSGDEGHMPPCERQQQQTGQEQQRRSLRGKVLASHLPRPRRVPGACGCLRAPHYQCVHVVEGDAVAMTACLCARARSKWRLRAHVHKRMYRTYAQADWLGIPLH